jgi:hypothetical protein
LKSYGNSSKTYEEIPHKRGHNPPYLRLHRRNGFWHHARIRILGNSFMMTDEQYEKFMGSAPAQKTPEFIDFLRDNNVVVLETDQWIVVENLKHHTPEYPWYTAFWKYRMRAKQDWYDDLDILWYYADWADWEWRKNDRRSQTIPDRFHIHLIKFSPESV